ncbi:MAG: SDR family oxidoreductase, partial [Gammaproteobacteria bacterium]
KLDLASFTLADLRDPASIEAAVRKIGGRVDGLFNCAGLPQTFPPLDVMKVNFAGTRHLTEQVLPLMSSGSAIVSISSNGGLGWSRRVPVLMQALGQRGFDAFMKWCEANADTVREGYAFSKELVIVWTMLMSQSLIKKGIRINCTLPGPTQTPMMSHFESATKASVLEAAAQPINRRSTPDEQAGPLVFLNSDAASYVNGVCFYVDGGFMAGLATGQIDPKSLMANAA